jgi:hypothetical protein
MSTRRLPPKDRRDAIMHLVVAHWILGMALGLACAALVLWLDIANLRSLIVRDDRIIWEGMLLLFGGFALTFGGVVSAGAIMILPKDDDDGDSGLGAPAADDAALRLSPVLISRDDAPRSSFRTCCSAQPG